MWRQLVYCLILTTVVAGVGMFVCTWVYMMNWVYTGEVGAKRLREKYLESVLRQDIAFFDTVGAGEVTTRIQTDTRKSQRLRFWPEFILNMT